MGTKAGNGKRSYPDKGLFLCLIHYPKYYALFGASESVMSIGRHSRCRHLDLEWEGVESCFNCPLFECLCFDLIPTSLTGPRPKLGSVLVSRFY
jgi:hypothetical protein